MNEEIDKIKQEILYWSNNCGGCETCSQLFGNRELTYDPETVWKLIVLIEEKEKEIQRLRVYER